MKNVNKKEMKTSLIISIFRKPILIIAALLCLSSVHAQEQIKLATKEVKTGSHPTINVSLYSTKTEIIPSIDGTIKAELKYRVNDKEEHYSKLQEMIEKDLINVSGKEITIDLSHIRSSAIEIMGIKRNKVTIKSKNSDESIKVKGLYIEYLKVWVPSSFDFKLNAKYTSVNIGTPIKGYCHIDLYDTQLNAMNIDGELYGKGKYSKIRVGKHLSSKLDLYECNFDGGETSSSTISAKYSTIELADLQDLKLEMYEGMLSADNVSSAFITSKYAQLAMNEIGTLKLEAYEGKCAFESVEELYLKAKYLDIAASKVHSFKMNEGYENNLAFDVVDELTSENGKYNKFAIDRLNQSLLLSGYEDELDLGSMSGEFKELNISGKYIDAYITIQSPKPYSLMGKVQYPDFILEENLYHIRKKIGDSDNIEIDYTFQEINETSPIIKVNGYEIDFTLKHR